MTEIWDGEPCDWPLDTVGDTTKLEKELRDRFRWLGGDAGVGTSFPSGAELVDGMVYEYLASASRGIRWAFRYREDNSFSLNGTTTSGSAVITAISSTEDLDVGMTVTGSGIQSASTISSIDSATQITLNKTATASATVSLTFVSPYHWEFVGGIALLHRVPTSQSLSAGATTYTDLATVGPDVTFPLNGTCRVEIGAYAENDTAGGGNPKARMSFAVGATAAIDGDSCMHKSTNPTVSGASVQTIGARKVVTAGTLLRAKFRTDNGSNIATFAQRYMSVFPVRVSG